MIVDETVVSFQRAKVYVFSDSVFCFGRVHQHPESNEAWKNRVAGVRAERNYRDFEDIKGETTEFEWNIFPGFTSLQLCDKVSNLLSSLGQTPESFTGRILFTSMLNDIFCNRYDNKDECLKIADFVKTFAKIFGIGQWFFIGSGSEKKWYPSENSPQGAWDNIAEEMLFLNSDGHGRLSIHFAADKLTIETFFALSFLSMSSVFTEQWRFYVKNLKGTKIEREQLRF